MSYVDKVLSAAGMEIVTPPDPQELRDEATGLISLAVSVGQEAGMSTEDLLMATLELAASGSDDDGDDDSGGDDDDDDDVTKDPAYKKMVAKGMNPKLAAKMVKNKKGSAKGGDGKKPNPFAKKK